MCTVEEIKEGKWNNIDLLVIDKVAYYHPYVKFKFSNGEKYIKQDFPTYEEAKDYYNEHCNLVPEPKLSIEYE